MEDTRAFISVTEKIKGEQSVIIIETAHKYTKTSHKFKTTIPYYFYNKNKICFDDMLRIIINVNMGLVCGVSRRSRCLSHIHTYICVIPNLYIPLYTCIHTHTHCPNSIIA